ncbi:MAG TPA: hypothetical protein DEQ58_06910 [Alcanivorax sp.]|nr:hypothetical protein [Alcanivorax sp.]MBF48787.1 hypothetical protein [Alcanivorax sp.]MBT75751.1 hypothetical protein [Alcanivorax sp.]HCD75183.1 hypothetical protein [Alcanivorax sp.]
MNPKSIISAHSDFVQFLKRRGEHFTNQIVAGLYIARIITQHHHDFNAVRQMLQKLIGTSGNDLWNFLKGFRDQATGALVFCFTILAGHTTANQGAKGNIALRVGYRIVQRYARRQRPQSLEYPFQPGPHTGESHIVKAAISIIICLGTAL